MCGLELISVIIPVYNVEKYLEKCVDSFIAQTYSNLEIILVDDGSTDLSSHICDAYLAKDSRIKVIHKKNGGLSDARNCGLETCTGELVVFYDSDDYVDVDYIEYLYQLKKKYNTQISACGCKIVYSNGKVMPSSKKEEECVLSKEEFLRRMLNEEGITVSAPDKLYDRELFAEIRFPVGRLCEDNGTTYLIIDKAEGQIAYGSLCKSYYNMRDGSIMNSSFTERKLDMIILNDEMCDYLDKKYPKLKNCILRRRIYARFNVLRQIPINEHKFDSIRDEMITFIMQHKLFIMSNHEVPKRDKIACIALSLGKRPFYLAWYLYSVLRKKI